ncbi:MurT ligase domain-containing protein [Herbiconiux sp. YIM B11900]|uniref:DUF1727 domain-containing protein n=1 Tax=Herbiconiux sp. YIM B11900 TaxID=3404131 RepID=UPI003F846767
MIKKALKMTGRNGSALPGLVVERLDPGFMTRILSSLPMGVVMVTGTNGKTTTTKMTTELLSAHGLKVFSNPTGSNYGRGITSAIISATDWRGRLNADIAVLEVDEGHAVRIVSELAPEHVAILNVSRDQMDRYGEIDRTVAMLRQAAAAARTSVLININDPRLTAAEFTPGSPASLRGFGVAPSILHRFPIDDELLAVRSEAPRIDDVTVLERVDPAPVVSFQGREYQFKLSFDGLHNQLNAAAAIALCRAVLGSRARTEVMFTALPTIPPAFGRGEVVDADGEAIEIVLVKNPAGFRVALDSFAGDRAHTMMVLNDNDADGRDVSWIWDVDFSVVPSVDTVSGSRAYDLALRLAYDDVPTDNVEPDIGTAGRRFARRHPGARKRVFCTYTAMLELRRTLGAETWGEAA